MSLVFTTLSKFSNRVKVRNEPRDEPCSIGHPLCHKRWFVCKASVQVLAVGIIQPVQLLFGAKRGISLEMADKKEEATGDHLCGIPIARVKRIIKSDPDVKLLASDASFLIAKSTELFLEMLAQKAYSRTKEFDRKTVQYKDLGKRTIPCWTHR